MIVIHSSINEIDPIQWEELVKNSPTASFFQTQACYNFYTSLPFMKPFVFAVSENERLVGVVCGYIISDGGSLKKFLSKRAIVPGGILLDANILQVTITVLLKHVSQVLSKKAIYTEIRNYNDYSSHRPFIESTGFKYHPHLNFHVSTSNLDDTFQKLNSSKRRQVKSTLKAGAIIEEAKTPQEVKELYELLNELYSTKIKSPFFPLDFFQRLNELQQAKLLVIKYKERVIGGIACVLLDKRVVYEWFVCGKDGIEKNLYPSVLATWAGMEYAAKNGFEYFDFMGAGKPDESYGVREFKSKFGGELLEQGRFLMINNPFLYSFGKLALRIYKIKKGHLKSDITNITLQIEQSIRNIDKKAWADFVMNHPCGTIFQTPQMYEVYEKTPNFTPHIVLALNDKGKMVGCLMSVLRSDFSILKMFTTRSIVMGGPLALNNDVEIVDQLLKSYNQFIGNKAIFSQFRNQFDMSTYKQVFKKTDTTLTSIWIF